MLEGNLSGEGARVGTKASPSSSSVPQAFASQISRGGYYTAAADDWRGLLNIPDIRERATWARYDEPKAAVSSSRNTLLATDGRTIPQRGGEDDHVPSWA